MAVVLQSQLILDSYDSNGGGLPTGDLLAAIEATFGTLKNLKQVSVKLVRLSLVLDGLCVQKAEKLKFVVLKPRQSINARCRLWRNTYFSNGRLGTCTIYQNRRPDYIEAFFSVINWTEVARRFARKK
jgi:Fe-Mn family superoxide dismutase